MTVSRGSVPALLVSSQGRISVTAQIRPCVILKALPERIEVYHCGDMLTVHQHCKCRIFALYYMQQVYINLERDTFQKAGGEIHAA
jgi:hypothetical protein